MAVKNKKVECALRRALLNEGFSLSPPRRDGETGVDIIALRNGEETYVEVIGYNAKPPARSRDFYEVWFRALSRVGQGARRCAIALPVEFQNGLNQRAAQYGQAWERLANAFPEVELWFVYHSDPDGPRREIGNWCRWAAVGPVGHTTPTPARPFTGSPRPAPSQRARPPRAR